MKIKVKDFIMSDELNSLAATAAASAANLRELDAAVARNTAAGNANTAATQAMAAGASALRAQMAAAASRVQNYTATIDNANSSTKAISQANRALSSDIRNQTKAIRDSSSTSKEAKEKLAAYTSQLVSSTNTETLKKSIEEQVKNNYRAARAQETTTSINESMAKAASMVSKPLAAVGTAAGTVFSAYQSGGSQIGTASASLQAGMELGGSAASGVGKIMTSVGPGLMALGPAGAVVGGVMTVVGTGLQLFGQGLSAAATTLLPKFSGEVEKNIQAFQSLSTSGAVFAGGMGEMIKVSGKAGYTVDGFSKIIAANKESFANSGLGMTEASKRFSETSNKMISGGFRKDLLNLGFTLDEQGGLVADVFSNLQRTGRLASTSDEDVAKQTKEYGENLRTVSALTGQDAKAKMAAAKKDMDNLGVQAKLLKLQKDQPQAYDKMQAMLAVMPDEMKNSFLQSFTGDAITDPAMNVLMENVPELRDAFAEMVKVVNDPNTSPAEAITAQSKAMNLAREGFIKNADRLGEIGTAANLGAKGVVADASKLGGSLGAGLAKFGPQTEKQGKAAAAAANTTDEQTQAMSKLIESNNDLNLKIQGTVLATGALTAYMNIAAESADMFGNLLDEIVTRFGKLPAEETKSRKAAQDAAKQQTAIVPGFTSPADIQRMNIDNEIKFREKELDSRKNVAEILGPDSARGTLNTNTNANRVKVLEEQLETLKQAKKEKEEAAKASGAPVAASSSTPGSAATTATPGVPVSENEDLSKLTSAEVNRRIRSMTPEEGAAFSARYQAAKRTAAQPKSPASSTLGTPQTAVPQQSRGSELPSNVEKLIIQNKDELEKRGVDLSPTGEFQKAVMDIKNNPGDGEMTRILNLIMEALQEGNQFHRDTAANTKRTVEAIQ